jgi:hypothetical protein
MEKCGYRSVIACSIRGFFCSMDVNLTMPTGRIFPSQRLERQIDAFGGLALACVQEVAGHRDPSTMEPYNRRGRDGHVNHGVPAIGLTESRSPKPDGHR